MEQLQAQLKYERRCRILAERELRELKGGWKTHWINNTKAPSSVYNMINTNY